MGPTVPSIFMLIISASSCLGFSKQLSQYSNYFHCSQIWHTESSDKTRANSRAENVKRKSGKLKWTKQTGEKLVCRQELIEIELVFRWSATIHTAHSPSKLNWITAEKSSLYEEYNTHSFLFGFWFRFRFAPIMLRLLLYFLKSLPRLLHISCIFHNPFVLWKNNEFYSLFAAVVADVWVHFRYVGQATFIVAFRDFPKKGRWAPSVCPSIFHAPFPLTTISHYPFAVSCWLCHWRWLSPVASGKIAI